MKVPWGGTQKIQLLACTVNLNVPFNEVPKRGTSLQGDAPKFQCFTHANNLGELCLTQIGTLKGVPIPKGYPENFSFHTLWQSWWIICYSKRYPKGGTPKKGYPKNFGVLHMLIILADHISFKGVPKHTHIWLTRIPSKHKKNEIFGGCTFGACTETCLTRVEPQGTTVRSLMPKGLV